MLRHLRILLLLLALVACRPAPETVAIAPGFYLATAAGVVHYGFDGRRTDLGFCAYEWPLLALADGLLYCTGRANLNDPMPELYVYDGRGAQVARTPVPRAVADWFVTFLPLASGLIAYGDNKDEIYLADRQGNLRAVLKIKDAADHALQSLNLLEVDGRLYASEDRELRILAFDLATGARRVAFDLSPLELLWPSGLTRDPETGTFFVYAKLDNRIYRLRPGQDPALLTRLPDYAPQLGFARGTVYAGAYGETLFAVDLRTGAVAEVVSGVPQAKDFGVAP